MQFDLEIYTETVFTYEKTALDKTIDVDVTDIPDIPLRAYGTYLGYMGSTTALYRYRISLWGGLWGTFAHISFDAVPPEKYAAEHPEYYNEQIKIVK